MDEAIDNLGPTFVSNRGLFLAIDRNLAIYSNKRIH